MEDIEKIESSTEIKNKKAWIGASIILGVAMVATGVYMVLKSPRNIIRKYNKTPRMKKPRKQRRILRRRKQKQIRIQNRNM